MPKISFDLKLSPELAEDVRSMARDAGCDEAMIFRRGLALMKVAISAQLTGQHIGLVRDASKLDVVFTDIMGK